MKEQQTQSFENINEICRYISFVNHEIVDKYVQILKKKIVIDQEYLEKNNLFIAEMKLNLEYFIKKHIAVLKMQHSQIFQQTFKDLIKYCEDNTKEAQNKLHFLTFQISRKIFLFQQSQIQRENILCEAVIQKLHHKHEEQMEKQFEIKKKMLAIQVERQQIFHQMLLFSDELYLKNLFVQKKQVSPALTFTEGFTRLKLFGEKRKAITTIIQNIEIQEVNIKESNYYLRQKSEEKNIYIQKIIQVFNEINKVKLCILNEINQKCNKNVQKNNYLKQNFSNLMIKIPMHCQIDYKKLDFSYIKKAVYLLLNEPELINKSLLTNHKEELVFLLQMPFQQIDNHKLFESEIQKAKDFIIILKKIFEVFCLEENQISKNIFSDFKQFIKKKPLRELLLFYLHKVGKQKGNEFTFKNKGNFKSVKQIMIDYLNECHDLYDSEDAIKLLMISYQFKFFCLEESVSFFEIIQPHHIWRSYQFWEASFLESIYQYYQILFKYYDFHQELESKEVHSRSSFSKIFSFMKWVGPKEITHDQDKKTKFQKKSKEVMENLAIIYLCNMIVLKIQKQITIKFLNLIQKALIAKNWTEEEMEAVKNKFQKIRMMSISKVKVLLENKHILEKIVTKLVDADNQQKNVKLSIYLENAIQSDYS